MQSPPSNNGSYLTQFIELHQYLKGSFYNEIGLNANFNMKREALGDGESSLNEDSLLPLCDEMLRCRQEDFDKVNEMFGTNIKVEFDSSWAQNVLEKELLLDKMKTEASQLADEQEEEGALSEQEESSETSEETEEQSDEEEYQEEQEDDDSQLADEQEEFSELDEEDDSQLADEQEDTSQLATEINITIINGDNNEVSDEDEVGDEDDEREISAS